MLQSVELAQSDEASETAVRLLELVDSTLTTVSTDEAKTLLEDMLCIVQQYTKMAVVAPSSPVNSSSPRSQTLASPISSPMHYPARTDSDLLELLRCIQNCEDCEGLTAQEAKALRQSVLNVGLTPVDSRLT